VNSRFSRRDFLKLTGLAPLGLASPGLMRTLSGLRVPPGPAQSVIVLVFDAFSAHNMSLHGYSRETTPNMARLARRAVVYHNHFASSNFTTPGTASLLTGTHPWTHRALQPNDGVAEHFATRNIFRVFHDYYGVAYTHNMWAQTLLRQFQSGIRELIPRATLFLKSYDAFISTLFKGDEDVASVGWARHMKLVGDGHAYSLFLSHVYEALQEAAVPENLKRRFPRGLPTGTAADVGFLLEDAVDSIGNLVTRIPRPFIGYFHFFPPHSPYHTPAEFCDRFKGDGYQAPQKPRDVFARGDARPLLLPRREYDEFVLYVDREFGRFYNALEASGLLDSTWLVCTSDHGEMFERGLQGHGNPTLYEPVIRVPLLIFEPGRNLGLDVSVPTSAVDLLPTLAHITGHPIPDWTEGMLLPPFGSAAPDPNRSVYAVEARENEKNAPLTQASTMLVKGRYKLHYYFGYRTPKVDQLVKLYDIHADPEELVDLSISQPDLTADLLADLKAKLAQADQPYQA